MTATRGRAFGLDIESSFPVLGLQAPREGPATRVVSAALAAVAEVESRVDAGSSPVARTAAMSIDGDPERGYVFRTAGHGAHWISGAADRLLCAPSPGAEDWRWQRHLVGQLLPFAAVMRGLEVLHAGAVVLEGQAVALVGPSGSGKSTLAMAMLGRGATFLTDDALALELAGPRVVAHPGTALASLDSSAPLAGLGVEVGRAGDEVRIALEGPSDQVPLGAVCFLDHGLPAAAPPIERESPVNPRLLLGSTFNAVLRSPERLEAQLDLTARTAETAAAFRVAVRDGSDPAILAEAIEAAVSAA